MRYSLATLLLIAAGVRAAPPSQLTLEPYILKVFDGTQTEAELGRLKVPEGSSESKLIQIAFLRLKSKSPAPGPPIVFLMGGAGRGIVMGQIPVFYRLFDQLRDAGDVLLLDQRGIGMAAPDFEALCPPGPAAPSDVLSNPARLLDVQLSAIRRCAAEAKARGIDIAAYSVANRASDLERLRLALKADRLRLLSWSAGTEVALETIRRYGNRIDAAVLAGTVGSDHILGLPSVADLHLRHISALAAADPSYKGSPDLFETVEMLMRRVERTPLIFTVTDPVSKQPREITAGRIALQTAIQAEMSDGRALPALPAWIYALAQGRQQAFQEKVAHMYAGLSSASLLGLAMGCERGWSEERLQRVRREALSSIVGTDGSPLPQACALLNLTRGQAPESPVFSPVRTLFVTGTLDSATPPFQGEEVRFGFPNSAHLLVDNATHDALVVPSVQAAIVSFLSGENLTAQRIAAPALRFPPPPGKNP